MFPTTTAQRMPPSDTDPCAWFAQAPRWDAQHPPLATWTRFHDTAPFPTAQQWAQHATYGPLDTFIRDPKVTQVHAPGPGRDVSIRRAGERTDVSLRVTWDPAWFPWLLQQLPLRADHHVANEHHQYGTIRVRTGDGEPCFLRYDIVVAPLCAHGPNLLVRLQRPTLISLEGLTHHDSLSLEAAEFLAGCMRSDIDLYVVGATATGKTTMTQALINAHTDRRLVVVETTPELRLPTDPMTGLHVGSLTPQDQANVVRMATRLQPHRIVVDDVRGADAYAVLAAARSGIPVLATMPGYDAWDGLSTLAAMALEAPESNGLLEGIYTMLNVRPAIVVTLGFAQSRRVVLAITEVIGQPTTARPRLEPCFERRDEQCTRMNYPSQSIQARLHAATAFPQAWWKEC